MPPSIEQLKEGFLSAVQQVNRLAITLTGLPDGVFGPISLTIARLEPPELGFLRAVAYLYSQYYEVGREGLPFVIEKLDLYHLDTDRGLRNHYGIVQQLRTFLYHNLNLDKERDASIREACEQWFHETCGARDPCGDAPWHQCVLRLMSEAAAFVSALLRVGELIAADDSRGELVRDWLNRIERTHAPEAFDRVIAVTATDMGREAVDVPRFRNRFYERWNQELASLRAGYDFEREARKLVERALLDAGTSVLPITGADIIQVFGIEPGPGIGEVLRVARQIYDLGPCNREVLLARLQREIDL